MKKSTFQQHKLNFATVKRPHNQVTKSRKNVFETPIKNIDNTKSSTIKTKIKTQPIAKKKNQNAIVPSIKSKYYQPTLKELLSKNNDNSSTYILNDDNFEQIKHEDSTKINSPPQPIMSSSSVHDSIMKTFLPTRGNMAASIVMQQKVQEPSSLSSLLLSSDADRIIYERKHRNEQAKQLLQSQEYSKTHSYIKPLPLSYKNLLSFFKIIHSILLINSNRNPEKALKLSNILHNINKPYSLNYQGIIKIFSQILELLPNYAEWTILTEKLDDIIVEILAIKLLYVSPLKQEEYKYGLFNKFQEKLLLKIESYHQEYIKAHHLEKLCSKPMTNWIADFPLEEYPLPEGIPPPPLRTSSLPFDSTKKLLKHYQSEMDEEKKRKDETKKIIIERSLVDINLLDEHIPLDYLAKEFRRIQNSSTLKNISDIDLRNECILRDLIRNNKIIAENIITHKPSKNISSDDQILLESSYYMVPLLHTLLTGRHQQNHCYHINRQKIIEDLSKQSQHPYSENTLLSFINILCHSFPKKFWIEDNILGKVIWIKSDWYNQYEEKIREIKTRTKKKYNFVNY